MDWEAIGSIGEAVGALAVLATLIYLAVQTKQTRLAVESGSAVTTQNLYSAWRNTFIESPHLADLVAKANSGAELSEKERLQFHFFCDEMFFAAAVSFTTSKQERGMESAMLEVEYITQMIKAIPPSIPEWERMRWILVGSVAELDEVVL